MEISRTVNGIRVICPTVVALESSMMMVLSGCVTDFSVYSVFITVSSKLSNVEGNTFLCAMFSEYTGGMLGN